MSAQSIFDTAKRIVSELDASDGRSFTLFTHGGQAELARAFVLAIQILNEGLRHKGGWREAIVELEDHCSEPVRLKNMIAAADQLDAWADKARTAVAGIQT